LFVAKLQKFVFLQNHCRFVLKAKRHVNRKILTDMSNQTEKLLKNLAEKLGTTAEYLWEVLLVQAKVQAIIDLVLILSALFFGFLLKKLHNYFYKNNCYSSKNEDMNLTDALMIIFGFLWVIFTIIVLFQIPEMLTGFFHPEYWALQEVLKTIK
jgi:hypothetical protein